MIKKNFKKLETKFLFRSIKIIIVKVKNKYLIKRKELLIENNIFSKNIDLREI